MEGGVSLAAEGAQRLCSCSPPPNHYAPLL